ncbi:heavy metal-associated domain-containing protein [Collinsella sp. An268]|uniref:heavy-metal-associated domain-containing protein n=1 Tax=Collinsella sp. An268 TaxID=1965612 RepID=UPI000B3AD44F|nr:heavy metal-associated domain-containing protein [Collinsella sp. An268]OUO63928.1 heavy metal transporter [Collinsella sp. An268]
MNYTIKTEGLHCGHCDASVETELMKVAGVTDADADHETNTVTVECDGEVAPEALEAAVCAAGDAFKVVSITAA